MTESMLSANFWRLMHAFGAVKAQLVCCTDDMLDAVARGKSLIAYNALGSYALRRELSPLNLEVVLPEDYVVVIARTIVIPRRAKNAVLAKQFVEYLLSERGQAAVAKAFGLAVVGGETDHVQMKTRYVAEKPGVINVPALGPNLLASLDPIKREQFVRTWRQIVSP